MHVGDAESIHNNAIIVVVEKRTRYKVWCSFSSSVYPSPLLKWFIW